MPAPRTLKAAAVLAGALALASVSVLAQQRETVPKRYQALYSELDSALTGFEQRLPQPTETTLQHAAVLAAARCSGSEEMLQPARREALALELTALRNVGADAAVLEVCYPLLTPAFHDARPYLEHYANLANEVRLRGLKLVVRHTLLPPTPARPALQRYWVRLSRARFAAEQLDEARAILYALQPDYLTLQADRAAQPAGNRLQPQDWSRLLRATAERLREDAGGTDTLLGAGIAPDADTALLDALARVPGLDYLDLQVYPVWWAGRDQVERLLEWPARVRAADPARRVILSETWLRKLGRSEQAKPPPEDQLQAREAFAFWAPLDRRYLELLGRVARSQAIELVAIARPQLLFAYLDFYDPIVFRLNSRALVELLTREFATAVRTQPPTPVGRAFGAM
jgi:hypothetical protein